MEETEKQRTCEERIAEHLESRMEDMRRFNGETRADESCDTLYKAANPKRDGDSLCNDCTDMAHPAVRDDDGDPIEYGDRPARCGDCGKEWPDEDGNLMDLGPLNEYGLSLDWVASDDRKREPFVRWQLSWGGPSDEFRFYLTAGPHGATCHRVEYKFMDWFDGAGRTLHGADLKIMCDLWETEFSECFQVSE